MAERFVEVVIRGPKGWDLGFLRGYLVGKGIGGELVEGDSEAFDCEPLRERLAELIAPSTETLHLFCPEGLVPGLKEAVAASGPAGHALELLHTEPVRGLSFRFELRVYSAELGARVRALFAALPEGAALEPESRFEERKDPEAKGAELYAPAHAYELEGEGRVAGDLSAVLKVLRACREIEQIHTSKAEVLRP